ncbi:MAG: hypothetical protein ACI97A_002473 [Planctomycetota bacterium]|jgi:hypothetical protein
MIRITALLLFLACLTCSPPAQAQNETEGQAVQELFQLSYLNLRTHGKSGYFEFYDQEEPDAFVGVWDPSGDKSACQTIVTVHGLLTYTVPAFEPHIFGIALAEPLYTDSQGSSWDEFGKHFGEDAGKEISSSVNPSNWESYNANQFQHMPNENMWDMVYGDPSKTANWSGALPGLQPFAGEFAWSMNAPLGPGKFYDQIAPFLPSLPPSTSPGGGSLIGMNVVLQIGVIDTNGSTPAAPKFTLTNAIGIQAMAGPPIKLNAGSGGNWGPPLASLTFKVENPNISMTASVPTTNGGTETVAVHIIDGTHVSFRLPRAAESGPLSFGSSQGPVSYITEPIAVVTHREVEELDIVGTPTFSTNVGANGNRVFGTSIIGNVTQIANKVLSIPVPADYLVYDLEVQLYPLDRTTMFAGAGTTVPVSLGVSPVAVSPVMTNAPATYIATPTAVTVLEQSFENLSGPIDLSLATNDPAMAGIDFLANIRVIEK